MNIKTILLLGTVPMIFLMLGIASHFMNNIDNISAVKTQQKVYDYFHNRKNKVDRDKLDKILFASLEREKSIEAVEISVKRLSYATRNGFILFAFLSLLFGFQLLQKDSVKRALDKSKENIKFTSKYLIMYLHMLILFFIIVVIDEGLDITWKPFVFGIIVMMPAAWIFTIYYDITLQDNSIKGYDVYGFYHIVEIDKITDIKPIQIAWLKYVRVLSPELKRPLWIPLFLNDMNLFIDEIEKKSEKNNSLRIFLLNEKKLI